MKGILRATWLWLLVKDRWATVLMLVFFTMLVLGGVTTSSIGTLQLTQDPAHPTTEQWGQPQSIRSDEYNVGTPIALSIMSTGGVPTLSPLGVAADLAHRFSSGGFFETIVFFQTGLLRLGTFLPQQMVFALYWWLPVIVLLLALPAWMEQIGAGRRLGWLAGLLIVFAPVSAWWSLVPVQTVAYTIAGCALLIGAYRRWLARRYVWFSVLAVLSGLMLAGLPTFYQPWSIVVGLPFLIATVLWILTRKCGLTSRLVPVAASGVVALVFAAGVFLDNAASTRALLGTVYPGQRRSTGAAQGFDFLFGSPGLGVLQNQTPTSSNASELSTAFTVTLVLAALVFVARRTFGAPGAKVVSVTFICAAAVWTAWVIVSFGGLGARIPLLNLVPPARATQVLGILGIVLLCLALSALPEHGGARLPVVVAAVSGVITLYSVSLLRENYLPHMTTAWIGLATVGTAAASFLIAWRPRALWAIAATSALAASVVIFTQPVLFGLSDLHNSDTAKQLRTAGISARADGTMWASNATSFDSVMLANGLPSLSGFQRSGPDVNQWKKLDPDGKFMNAWNRAGGYIPFVFTPGKKTNITTNGFDVTFVAVDPCTLKNAFPSLARIASANPIHESCLVSAGSMKWADRTMHIYSFTAGS